MNATTWDWLARQARRVTSFAAQAAESLVSAAWSAAVTHPLRTLYFHGPNIRGYGFWGGIADSDMCAQLTSVSSLMWDSQAAACRDLLERNFAAFYTAVLSALYAWLAYKLLQCLLFRYAYMRPIVAELRGLVADMQKNPTFLESGGKILEHHARAAGVSERCANLWTASARSRHSRNGRTRSGSVDGGCLYVSPSSNSGSTYPHSDCSGSTEQSPALLRGHAGRGQRRSSRLRSNSS